jgi:hypothetical protein
MDLRPLSVGELLDQTFRLFRQAWRPLILLGLLSILPSVLFATLSIPFQPNLPFRGTYTANQIQMLLQVIQTDWTVIFGQLLLLLVYLLIVALITPLVQGALIHVASGAILRQPVTAKEALRAALRRYGALVGTAVLIFLLQLVAFPVLAIGGLLIFAFVTIPAGYIALTVFFLFRQQAILLEGAEGGVPSLKRSYALVKGRFWPLLGAGLIFTLLVLVLGWIIGLFNGVLVTVLHFALMPATLTAWLSTLISSLPAIVVTPFMMVGVTLAYYETRTRKEGLDMTLSVDALDSPSDAPR